MLLVVHVYFGNMQLAVLLLVLLCFSSTHLAKYLKVENDLVYSNVLQLP